MGTRLPGRGLLTVAAAIALVGLGACGDPNQVGAPLDASTTLDAPTSAVAPATSAPPLPVTTVPGATPTVALTTPDQRAGAVLEPGAAWCPPMTPPPSLTEDEMRHGDQVAGRVLGVVQAYVTEHTDVGGMPWLDWPASGPRVVIGFTHEVAAHTAALRAQIADPAELLVCQARHTNAELATANAEIQQQMMADSNPGVFMGVGQGINAVEVTLRADQAALADDLLARYGDLVAITLGLFPYPIDSRPADQRTANVCAQVDVSGPTTLDGLHATAAPEPATVTAGLEFAGTVTVTNTGSVPASFTAGEPLVGYLVRPGTDDVVGLSIMGVGGVGLGPTLAPGESRSIKLQAGTASCTPDRYTVTPGRYELIVPVVQSAATGPTDRPRNLLVTERATVTVVA